jgi:hypothetical protein
VYAVTLTSVPVAGLLGPEALDMHMLARLRRPGKRRFPPPPAKLIYTVEAIFRVGAADIVFVTQSEERRFPAATESRLLTLLEERAKGNTL